VFSVVHAKVSSNSICSGLRRFHRGLISIIFIWLISIGACDFTAIDNLFGRIRATDQNVRKDAARFGRSNFQPLEPKSSLSFLILRSEPRFA
jgi:hypothetical protein